MPIVEDTENSYVSAQHPPVNQFPREGLVFFKDPVPIELIFTSDKYTQLKLGAKGKATGWNKQPGNIYTLFVTWENGGNMGLIYSEDKWKVINDNRKNPR